VRPFCFNPQCTLWTVGHCFAYGPSGQSVRADGKGMDAYGPEERTALADR